LLFGVMLKSKKIQTLLSLWAIRFKSSIRMQDAQGRPGVPQVN
jgi:hypothetical protein